MKNKKLLFTFILSFFSTIIVAQKTIKYEYSGGSHDVNKELLLYTDSTFTFNLEMGFPFGHSRKTKGFYIIEDSLLTLITKKRFAFLYRKNHKHNLNECRIKGDKLLMYSKEDEYGKDSKFIMDYNTLSLIK